MQSTTQLFVLSWPCLQDDAPPPPTKPKTASFVQQKTFVQAVNNVCDIPHSQLPKPCVKGNEIAIEIPDDEYDAGLKDCKHNLQGRVIWPKGTAPVSLESLKIRLTTLWKSLGRWGIISLGKGCYEFVFSSVEDLRSVRSVGSWNLSSGILKLFVGSENFSPNTQLKTNAQVWVRLYRLSQEYWRKKTLFAIASSVGTPICTDSVSGKPMIERTFGHYARVLVDVDLSTDLRYMVLVERKGYAFFVDLEYENLPDFCAYCKIPGHHIDICKKRNMGNTNKAQKEKNKKKDHVVVRKHYVPVVRGNNEGFVDTSNAQAKGQTRNEEDLQLEKEINEELQATQDEHATQQASSNKSIPETSDLNDDAHSSSGSLFVDATQEIERAEDKSPTEKETTPEAILKDMNFLKESWANLEDAHNTDDEDEEAMSRSNNNTSRYAGADISQTRILNFNVNTENLLSKSSDSVNPSNDDHGFQLVTTRASKKDAKLKTVSQNSYPLRSRAATSKPFK